jgi:hypothetical protein
MRVVLLLIICFVAVSGIDVTGTVRGRRYTFKADTVQEFLNKVEVSASLEPGQNAVLFNGKLLAPSDVLSTVGVTPADVLTVVKDKKRSHNPLRSMPAKLGRPSPSAVNDGGDSSPDANQASAPEGGEQQVQAMMERMLEPGFLEEFFSDEAKLEKARQDILASADQYERLIPGFKEQAQEMASSPQKWKESMLRAKEQLLQQRDILKQKTKSNQAGSSKSTAALPDSVNKSSQ